MRNIKVTTEIKLAYTSIRPVMKEGLIVIVGAKFEIYLSCPAMTTISHLGYIY